MIGDEQRVLAKFSERTHNDFHKYRDPCAIRDSKNNLICDAKRVTDQPKAVNGCRRLFGYVVKFYLLVIIVASLLNVQLFLRFGCGGNMFVGIFESFFGAAFYAGLPPPLFIADGLKMRRLPPTLDIFLFAAWPDQYESFKKQHIRNCILYTREIDRKDPVKVRKFLKEHDLTEEELMCFTSAGYGPGTVSSACFEGFDSFNKMCFNDSTHICNHPMFISQFTVARRT